MVCDGIHMDCDGIVWNVWIVKFLRVCDVMYGLGCDVIRG